MSHTPGPWKVDEDGHIEAHGGIVCMLIDTDYTIAQDKQNAALIAAAPDLLEALRGILKIRSGRTVKAARAAIAKAEGTSNA